MKLVALILLLSSAGFTQEAKNPISNVLREMLPSRAKNTVGAIEEMPADKFNYKPTPEQMTFGHLAAHITDGNCKDKLVAAVKASFDFCTTALAKADDSKLNDNITWFDGKPRARAWAFVALASSWADHYGAAAMYLRLNGKEARRKEVSRERPTIVTAIAALFLLSAVYLLIVGLTMLARPGFLSMAAGADLLSGLETAGPYMFLVVSAAGIAVGFGLLRLQNWARRIAALLALIGIVLLVPRVSSAVVAARGSALAWSGLGIIVRVVIVVSLYQAPVTEIFETK